MGLYYTAKPLAIVDLPADADHYSLGRTSAPKAIFLHHTGGTDSKLWLTKTSVPPVSSHRLIDRDGTIYKLVADHDTAWTQGYGIMGPYGEKGAPSLNSIGLSIELENLGDGKQSYPQAQIMSTALQVNEWWAIYGYLPVLAHAMVDSRKTDPRLFPWSSLFRALRALQCEMRGN